MHKKESTSRGKGKELVEKGMPHLLPKAYKYSPANENTSMKI